MRHKESGMTPQEPDIIMTVKDVAAFLKLAESTVYRLAQEGTLPGRKIGGTWRFSREQLLAWFYQSQSGTPPEP